MKARLTPQEVAHLVVRLFRDNELYFLRDRGFRYAATIGSHVASDHWLRSMFTRTLEDLQV